MVKTRFARSLVPFGMTTSISSPENSAMVSHEAAAHVVQVATTGITHSLASRFAFLLLCVAIILSALVYGTVHYWALAVFFLGAVLMLILWLADGWIWLGPPSGPCVSQFSRLCRLWRWLYQRELPWSHGRRVIGEENR